jgi:hypothetical protein
MNHGRDRTPTEVHITEGKENCRKLADCFLFHWIPGDSSRSGCDEIQAVATGLEVVDFPQLLCWMCECCYFKGYDKTPIVAG